LAGAGADVAVGYRDRAAAAEEVVQAIKALGRRGLAVQGDLSEEDDAARVVGGAVGVLEGLDIVVANAGVWPADDVSVAGMTEAQWRGTHGANLDAVFYTLRAAIPHLPEGGRIVIVSSTAGQRGEAFHADYASTKGALIALTKSLAIELAPRVTVNCVAPGWVNTEMVRPVSADGRLEAIAAAIPLGRLATAEDVAGPVAFLCSELARHITGEILNVNGGSVLCG
jgi:3-oxoacyl-[acyl-carrier protein] reductase